MDLPPTIFPTLPPIEFGLKVDSNHGSEAFCPLLEDPVHMGHRDPVHMGLTYPVRTDHTEHFGLFLFCTILTPHHHLCSSAIFLVVVRALGCSFFRVLRCFGYLGVIWMSSSPPLDHQLGLHNIFKNIIFIPTVSKDSNLNDAFVLHLPLPL